MRPTSDDPSLSNSYRTPRFLIPEQIRALVIVLRLLESIRDTPWRMRQFLDELEAATQLLPESVVPEDCRYLQEMYSQVRRFHCIHDLCEKQLWLDMQEYRLRKEHHKLRQRLLQQIPEIDRRLRDLTAQAA